MTVFTSSSALTAAENKRGDTAPVKTENATAHASLTENRLGTRPSQLLITHVNKLELDDELVSLDEYVLTDLAHAVMLTHTGIFDAQHGSSIVQALLDLRAGDTAAILASDPEVGTLGLQIEQYLENILGPHGRDIQRARSRIDQKATNWRLVNRASLTDVIDELVSLGAAILATAGRYAGALMPGYTHLQHSQPTTIDHYLNAHYWAVSRNLDRLFDAYDRLNLSPLGGAAYSGTVWPIDRTATAIYLGFDRPIPNARDAGLASLDMGAELASVLAATLSAISRLASDLNYWSSSEVGLVRIDASLCGTSSMMPQKRNPMVLERIRGLAGVAVGWAASQLGVMHTATSTDVDQAYIHNLLPGQCAETVGAIALLREVIATVEFDVPAMHISAGQHWATASALADALVASRGISFRDAHESVAHLVAAHERAGVASGELHDELIEGKAISAFPAAELRTILDPEAFVNSRISSGGTAAATRDALATAALADLDVKKNNLQLRTSQVAKGLGLLLNDAQALTVPS
ncbi:argininosuccinate lyase [Pyrenochaeta sp. MPI-SDFR-AT-0127]|nr:argininosuccinate lyase [Pyrenochaeta sp. MPI-SDFR-AT-0127]